MPDVLTGACLQLALDASSLKGVLGVVLGVGLLIFIHELGHFLAAKWAGVKVEVFSLGFGHRLCGFERGGTDYRISALPLGGYVRMLGQADDDPFAASTQDPADFRNKSPGKRFVILVAGVVMNLLLAGVGFVLAFGLGIEFTAAEVGGVEPGSAAARADLRPGDVILRADGTDVLGLNDLQTVVAVSNGPMSLTVLRDGKTHEVVAHPFRGVSDRFTRLGVESTSVLADLAPGSPLQGKVVPATLTQSDRLQNVSPVGSRCAPERRMTALELERAVEAAQGPQAITLARTTYDKDGLPLRTELVPLEVEPTRRPEYTIGLEAAVADQAWVRGSQDPKAPAARAGVLEGDRIAVLGDREDIRSSNLVEVVRDVGARLGEGPHRLVVERPEADGSATRRELKVTLLLENPQAIEEALARAGPAEEARLEARRGAGRWYLGVAHRADVVTSPCRLTPAEEGAAPIELGPGDRIAGFWTEGGLWWSNESAFSAIGFRGFLRARGEEPFKLAWIPKGQTSKQTAVVKAKKDGDRTWADLGLVKAQRQVIVHRGPVDACVLGAHQTVVQTRRIFEMLRSFLTGGVSPGELGGPIMIVSTAYTIATGDSLAKLIHLLAILSVNLAVINILPIPVLDGGHILFLGIEKLRGKPVSNDIMWYAQWAGLLVILGLMVLVFFNDIRRLVS